MCHIVIFLSPSNFKKSIQTCSLNAIQNPYSTGYSDYANLFIILCNIILHIFYFIVYYPPLYSPLNNNVDWFDWIPIMVLSSQLSTQQNKCALDNFFLYTASRHRFNWTFLSVPFHCSMDIFFWSYCAVVLLRTIDHFATWEYQIEWKIIIDPLCGKCTL